MEEKTAIFRDGRRIEKGKSNSEERLITLKPFQKEKKMPIRSPIVVDPPATMRPVSESL